WAFLRLGHESSAHSRSSLGDNLSNCGDHALRKFQCVSTSSPLPVIALCITSFIARICASASAISSAAASEYGGMACSIRGMAANGYPRPRSVLAKSRAVSPEASLAKVTLFICSSSHAGCRVTKHPNPNLIANFESRHITTLGRQRPRKPFHPIDHQWKFPALFVQQAGVKHRTLGPSDMPGGVAAGHSPA